MPQDHTAVAKVRAQVEQVVAFFSDQPDPERHNLHVAACPCRGHGELAEVALDLNDREHELRIEACPRGFIMHRSQQIQAGTKVGDALFDALRHLREPAYGFHGVRKCVARSGRIGNRGLQPGAHAGGKRFVDLCTRMHRTCPGHRDAGNPGTRHFHHDNLERRTVAASPSATRSACLSRRPWYSITPSFNPRSPTTMRCGIPSSSMSANMTPGRSSRSSSSTSMPIAVSSWYIASAVSRPSA